MELWQFIAYKKTQDRLFTQTQFAKDVKCSGPRMSQLIHYKHVPSVLLAMAIENYTDGMVDPWNLIKRCVEARDKKGQGSPPNS